MRPKSPLPHCFKIAWNFRKRQHGPLLQNRVDLPELWHCFIASLPQNRVELLGRTNNFNDLQIVANEKKPRGPEDIRKGTRKLHEHAPTVPAACFVSKHKRLHPPPFMNRSYRAGGSRL
jgi:hypothetical protein